MMNQLVVSQSQWQAIDKKEWVSQSDEKEQVNLTMIGTRGSLSVWQAHVWNDNGENWWACETTIIICQQLHWKSGEWLATTVMMVSWCSDNGDDGLNNACENKAGNICLKEWSWHNLAARMAPLWHWLSSDTVHIVKIQQQLLPQLLPLQRQCCIACDFQLMRFIKRKGLFQHVCLPTCLWLLASSSSGSSKWKIHANFPHVKMDS